MMRFSEYLTLLSTEGRTCRARGRGSGAGGRGACVGPRRSGGAHGPIGGSRRPEPPGAGVGRGAARGGAGAGRASEHAADEHVAVVRLHGQRPAVGDAAPAAAAHEGCHLLHTCTGVCVCVCVQCVRAACDASHLLGRPDLGGCVVVVDGHILLLPGVLYLVRARARVRVKVRPRQGWRESVGVCWCACTSVWLCSPRCALCCRMSRTITSRRRDDIWSSASMYATMLTCGGMGRWCSPRKSR